MKELDISLRMDIYRGFDIIISHKYKFIYCLIQKNGSSTIMSSILNYEYEVPREEINKRNCIWNTIRINKDLLNIKNNIFISFKNTSDLKNFISNYPDYKIFIVLRNPIERTLSWCNYLKYLYPKEYIKCGNLDEVKNTYDKIKTTESLNEHVVDYHILPQHIFYNFFKEACEDRLEIVHLNDLRNYCKEMFGFEIVINNKNNSKPFFQECLSEYECKIIESISDQDKIMELI